MTHTLMLCLTQLREIVQGPAEINVTLQLIDTLTQLLAKDHEGHQHQIEQMQKDIKKAKKQTQILKKQNNTLKATISNQRSDLDMMDIKNKKLHKDLMKFQEQEYKQERKQDRKGLKQTKEISIECDLLNPNFVDNICQLYQQQRRDNVNIQNQIGQLTDKVTKLEESKNMEQFQTSTLHDSDQQKSQTMSECFDNPQQIVGSWQPKTDNLYKFDVPSNNIVSRMFHKLGNLFTKESANLIQ